MNCYICGKDIGKKLGACEECSQKRAEQLEQDRAAIENARPTRVALSADNRKQAFLAYFLPGVAFVIFFLIYEVFAPGRVIKQVDLQSNAGAYDPCEEKKQCLISYVAPWCPACRNSTATLRALRDRYSKSADLGVKIVVGADELFALEEYGREIGGQVFYDPDGQYRESVLIGNIPYLLLVDAEGMVIHEDSGLPAGNPDAATLASIARRFGLPES